MRNGFYFCWVATCNVLFNAFISIKLWVTRICLQKEFFKNSFTVIRIFKMKENKYKNKPAFYLLFKYQSETSLFFSSMSSNKMPESYCKGFNIT